MNPLLLLALMSLSEKKEVNSNNSSSTNLNDISELHIAEENPESTFESKSTFEPESDTNLGTNFESESLLEPKSNSESEPLLEPKSNSESKLHYALNHINPYHDEDSYVAELSMLLTKKDHEIRSLKQTIDSISKQYDDLREVAEQYKEEAAKWHYLFLSKST